MSAAHEENKRTVIRFYDEVVNGKAPDALQTLLHPTFRDHTSDLAFDDIGQFPVEDITVTVEEVIGEGELVATRWQATAVPKGQSKADLSWGGTTIFRMGEGKIGERWTFPDLAPVLSTLLDTLGGFGVQ